ncbi:beta strand repeat-containing protein [Sphingomonas sp. RT2P30]|uniref:beta strand repeat-containing protein n=1 Tax=Parasphingomonas halimpatiens TaxID=3096162 RepID=UPI002FCC8466
MTRRRARRSQLLAGGAIALTVLLALPVSAQSIDATALRSAINKQSTASGTISADASSGTAAASFSSIQAGTVSVADNQISAAAGANSATTSLDPVRSSSGLGASPTTISIHGSATSGQADNLLANSQRMMSAPVRATLLGGQTGITAGSVSAGDLSVANNDLEASALGNQAVDQLGLDNADLGAGLVSAQTGDATSSVSASNDGVTQLAITGASASRLDLSGNNSVARAGGNVASDALSVSATSVVAPAGSLPASTVSAAADDTNVANALYTNLGRQQLAGQVSAVVGSAPASFSVDVSGDLNASSASADSNAVAAVASGNQSSRSLALTAGSVSPADEVGAAIANVTGVQRVVAGGVSATANGGTTIGVDGALYGSDLSASRNQMRAVATGNRADGNLLTVDANRIDSGGGLPWGTVGTAMTGNDGVSSTTAAFSVHNVQELDAGVSAGVSGGATLVAIAGPVDHATLAASDNVTAAAAMGNSATNGATLQADALRGSVDLNNAQTVDGSIRSVVGTSGDRAGARIEPFGSVAGSQLRVTGNSVTGAAVASSASNSLTVTGNSVSAGSGHVDATAGQVDSGYGAAANVALANYQKFGMPLATGPAASSVTSNVAGKFAIGDVGYTNGSTLMLDNNSQAATAVGNTALDRLSLTATSLPGVSSPAAGTALSSSQFGDGSVVANSDMVVVTRGGVGNSAVSLRGNANRAVAVMNDADNGLSVSAVKLDGVTGGAASADAGNLGSASVTGDHVLSGTQFANGTVGAAAQTRLVNSDAGATMSGSSFTVSDNSTVADASANHAVNAVSVSSTGGTGATAGLANSQMSAATVNASARTDATLGLGGTATGTAIYGSSVTIADNLTQAVARGNSADNALTLNGPVNAALTGASSAQVGSFDTVATAPTVLVNAQSNDGAVTASAGGTMGVPLNAAGSVASSALAVTGNAMTANAYGNAATNQVMIGSPGAARGAVLSNVQTNDGPVSASVAGASFAVRGAQLSNGALTMSGNQLAASATGNIANSAITAGH